MGNNTILRLLFLLVTLHNQCWRIEGTCYFPSEYQGEYKMQNAVNSGTGVQYSTLNISANAIPIWGNCHRRIGNNYILMFNYGENNCIRCLHLQLRSRNVLQVHASSQETISKCYTNEESAVTNCPTEESLQNRSSAEIILFKTKEIDDSYTKREYCPFDGKYSLQYKMNDILNKKQCLGHDSSLDTCPSGSALNLRFRRCSFESYDLKFDCLGHWDAPNGQTYLALVDSLHTKNEKTQYRCALYSQNPSTGVIHVTIGQDSTCGNDLYNSTYGYETLVLTPKIENTWPPEVLYSQCSFPDWIIGNWEQVRVEDNTFIYKDHSSFKTYTIKCVGMLDSEDKYLIFSKTQCDEEQYNCLRIQRRSHNIMEFQLGTNFSSTKDVFDLCADSNFNEGAWITQGRVDRKMEASCPISGEYTGLIPDSTDLCAKLWSDCRAPELMYYQVSDCGTDEIYEEREYRCLGHWQETQLLYTYTQRRDVAPGTFECFVGSIISDKEDIYIKEAGEHCQRQVDPLKYGMKLMKQGLYSCIGHISTIKHDSSTQKTTILPSTRMATKPWNVAVPYSTIVPESGDSNNINKAPSIKSICWSLLSLISSAVILCL